MRANKIMHYTSILQVLGECGCPFCRFLKDFQAAALQSPRKTSVHHLCNFHTWGLAAMQRAPFAAELFLTLLEEDPPSSPNLPCDICLLLWKEEDLRIREFVSSLNHKLVRQWLRSQATLCLIHGTKLKQGASPVLASTIHTVMERNRKQLADDLESFVTNTVRIQPTVACSDMRPSFSHPSVVFTPKRNTHVNCWKSRQGLNLSQ